MNRSELLRRLAELPFDRKEYWLAAGGAMVLYGFREETGDIDLGSSGALADDLEQQGYPTTMLKDGTRRITYAEDIEIFENWLQDRVIIQDNVPVVSVEGLIRMKKALGRAKDHRDIELIEKCMAEGGEKREN
ncbi:MAG: hypothetical protein J6I98_03205 [Clostridia bacterium]|nr:hypothetical protein [Clostridia bacterium]